MNIAKTITRGNYLYQDLLNSVLLELLSQDAIVLKSNNENDFKYFITGLLSRNWHSKTSRFYYADRKENSNYVEFQPNVEIIDTVDETIEKEERICAMEDAYCGLPIYNRALIDTYMAQGSLKRTSKVTGIPLTSISRGINFAKEHIKNEMKKGK